MGSISETRNVLMCQICRHSGYHWFGKLAVAYIMKEQHHSRVLGAWSSVMVARLKLWRKSPFTPCTQSLNICQKFWEVQVKPCSPQERVLRGSPSVTPWGNNRNNYCRDLAPGKCLRLFWNFFSSTRLILCIVPMFVGLLQGEKPRKTQVFSWQQNGAWNFFVEILKEKWPCFKPIHDEVRHICSMCRASFNRRFYR